MAAMANPLKRWHIVLRCTICGPLGLLFNTATVFYIMHMKTNKIKYCATDFFKRIFKKEIHSNSRLLNAIPRYMGNSIFRTKAND